MQLALSPEPRRERGTLSDEEKKLAAVVGILEADGALPPAFHRVGVAVPFNPSDEARKQAFGKAAFTALGEYRTTLICSRPSCQCSCRKVLRGRSTR